MLTRILMLTAIAALPFGLLQAQGSYEIQVYGSGKVVNAGFEYYGALGPVTGFDPLQPTCHPPIMPAERFRASRS